jgi:hypothetical protein
MQQKEKTDAAIAEMQISVCFHLRLNLQTGLI